MTTALSFELFSFFLFFGSLAPLLRWCVQEPLRVFCACCSSRTVGSILFVILRCVTSWWAWPCSLVLAPAYWPPRMGTGLWNVRVLFQLSPYRPWVCEDDCRLCEGVVCEGVMCVGVGCAGVRCVRVCRCGVCAGVVCGCVYVWCVCMWREEGVTGSTLSSPWAGDIWQPLQWTTVEPLLKDSPN